MKTLIIVILTLALAGCGNPTPKVTPDKLTTATYGASYNEVINISGGYISRKSIDIIITPPDSGLTWSPEVSYLTFQGETQKNEDFHTITISGVPLIKNPIQIYISGNTYGTSYAGKEFKKIYKIDVK
ncbi:MULTISPECIES: hypothetical protein [Morganellaceae]|uniref:Lipoprotein n=2 Tax=Morganellaceae TaxID=1903414 RepID=A0A1B8HD29_9GAMM|nr:MULTISPECIES: hypothetical protein [Morganellaceae]ELR5072033.1 hypothetical protein [Providencia rettgeri]ELR5204361.1 hypothetical protein [Providencia rettgeri]MDV5235707.1 hypothetical protein [Providencia rettgeri]OBU06963.1 hypothetical protein AYY17_19715 [Morganella psychrotolerans]UNH29169.1 hypothetical protein MNY64_16660 [Moellerella wisconsensis]